jgi:Reverse transcriptase (RNA-dependent DNA polymerase)
MGVHVNLDRALNRITDRTNNKRTCYGLFIDFQNAYNSVPLTLLFKKLREKQIFDQDEVNYMEQLYARYRIRIGDNIFAYNKGLAQGSIISPALFNIFIEDLGKELQEKADINMQDILMYADDIMTICSSRDQLNKAIIIIEEWSQRNGMALNKKKSGIVVFAPRKATKITMMKHQEDKDDKTQSKKGRRKAKIWVPANKDILGIPICEKYKYLGTWLSPKLTCVPQIGQIKKKAGFLFIKLYAYLSQATADGRRDMFMTMVAPLFNAAHILLSYEPSTTHRKNLQTVWICIFK